MKCQIRNGVFETNSSSMHSLVVTKNDEYYTEDEVRDSCGLWKERKSGTNSYKHIYYDDLRFGRSPFEVLTTFYKKVKYTLASMCKYKNDTVYNEVCDVIRSYVPEFIGFELREFAETIDKSCYSEDDIIRTYGENNYTSNDDFWIVWGYETGYVDENILSGFLEQENISIREFLLNKKYIVVVDGDEYCIYNTMKKSGLINTAFIEREYPNREGEL